MRLTLEQIEKYASRKGVKRIAVVNFLSTIDSESDTRIGCTMNCHMDEALYGWNRATVTAIEAGIRDLFDAETRSRKQPCRR
jgi:hypothetical protein